MIIFISVFPYAENLSVQNAPKSYGQRGLWHPQRPLHLRGVVGPAFLQLLLPVDPGLGLGVHVVLVHGVLVGEGAISLADHVVNLLAAVLVHGAADGPDHAEKKPQLHHAGEVVRIRGVHLIDSTSNQTDWTGSPLPLCTAHRNH